MFGSRARGDATPASDYDLLLIYEDSSTLERLLEDLGEARIPVDVHSFTLEEALEALPYSTVILDALTEGVVLKEDLPLKPLMEKLKSLKRRGTGKWREAGSSVEVVGIARKRFIPFQSE